MRNEKKKKKYIKTYNWYEFGVQFYIQWIDIFDVNISQTLTEVVGEILEVLHIL